MTAALRPAARRDRSTPAPFPRIVCALDGGAGTDAALEQAIALAGADADARIVFAVASGPGADERAWSAVTRAVEAGVEASAEFHDAEHLGDVLRARAARSDLVVVGAHPHARATGILLGELATLLVRRARCPVLVARDRPLDAGVVAATRDPVGRAVAAVLGARLSFVGAGDAGAIVAAAERSGLVVVGDDRRRGLRALTSVSERVAHLAPCSVLVTRA